MSLVEQEHFIGIDELTDKDIICGTGPVAFNHVGTTKDKARNACVFVFIKTHGILFSLRIHH
jgi:hypothetical protein